MKEQSTHHSHSRSSPNTGNSRWGDSGRHLAPSGRLEASLDLDRYLDRYLDLREEVPASLVRVLNPPAPQESRKM